MRLAKLLFVLFAAVGAVILGLLDHREATRKRLENV